MTIHWGALLAVFATSMGSAVAVVALVAAALLGLSARAPRIVSGDAAPRLSPRAGTAVAAACLTGATAIVLVGLWAIVVR
jgi:hypothetical protein